MDNCIDIGSGLSVDEVLVKEIEEFVNHEDATDAYNNKNINMALRSAARSSSTIVGIAVAAQDGILYQFDKNEMRTTGSKYIWDETNMSNITEAFAALREKSADNVIPRYEIITHPMIHPNIKEKGLIHIAFPLKDSYSYADMKYMIVITYDSAAMEDLLKQLSHNQEEYIQGYIEDAKGEILLHTKGSQYSGVTSNHYKMENEVTDLTARVGKYQWTLHAVIDEQMIRNKVDEMYGHMVFLYVVAILFIMAILFWVTNRILKPVNVISNSIARVKDGDTREQIEIEGTNEIWQLAQEYNEMMKAIQDAKAAVEQQHGQMIESMRMKQRAEREALESQINAHFICNTLNAINYEAIDSGNYKVSVLLKKLSNILRYTFDQKHQNVYMFQEISWIEQYLFLQKERLDQVFTYEIDFDSDYDNWPCRKLMLQPFVENSILHGFEGKEYGGKILIRGYGYKEFLKIEIEDNGCGMTEEKEQIIQEILDNPMVAKEKEVGIGISNVITRMRMYYGEEFRVTLDTREGEGSKFIFILPTPKDICRKVV
nr:histidine kinase [uncultured Blautia sp.]